MATTNANVQDTPENAKAAVFVHSVPISDDAISVVGPDLSGMNEIVSLLESYKRIGFQATALANAVEIVNNMRKWRLSDEPVHPDEMGEVDHSTRANKKCTIFLGFTSNLMSSGLREVIRFLVKHRHVSAIVTTAGGIEEDFIKCLGKTYLADFALDGAELRRKGLNRIGNLVVPNDNYCKFEDWVIPILDEMLKEQKSTGVVWTPSSVINRLGKEIDNEESVYYWAYKARRAIHAR
ncbi:Deoxyhypusine synthase [Serendipita sp. 401]|nr:Deoxyhypusine synthase [Serendipita sp. 401]